MKFHDIVILDPEWFLKAIAYLVHDKETRANGGVLTERRLPAIWLDHNRPEKENPYRYKKHEWRYLIALMAQSGILYTLVEEKEWLVPALLPPAFPAELPWDGCSADDYGEPLRLECRLNHPFPGLMAQLIALYHPFHVSRTYIWSKGAFLSDPYWKDQALIVETEADTAISFFVRGATAGKILAAVGRRP